jgi:hypothetical protein
VGPSFGGDGVQAEDVGEDRDEQVACEGDERGVAGGSGVDAQVAELVCEGELAGWV